MSKQSCGTPEPKADCHSKCRSSPTRTLIIVLPLWSLRADKLTFPDLPFLTPSKSRAQCFQDSSRITLHTDPLVIHMDLHILLYWSSNRIRLGSEVKNLQSRSSELQNYDQLPEVDCPAVRIPSTSRQPSYETRPDNGLTHSETFSHRLRKRI